MKYPIGIQTFSEMRNNGFVYVDKTALVYELANTGKYYFLSRPRRFGKSLMVSTMEAYFSGRKELFGGLAVSKLETEWKPSPVFHIDLNAEKYNSPHDLDIILNDILSKWEEVYGSSPSEQSFSRRFSGIVQRACEQTGRQVVVLVDEYDKPLLQTVDKPELQETYRNTLKAFYGVLKSQDRYIRFGFLTGVTKFSHVSIFSDLNNLRDISMDGRYADICGISGDELHVFLDESIKELAAANGMTYEETCGRLKEQYDGYHFCEDSAGVYNPYSLLNTFASNTFRDYWFSTGTPTFLMRLLRRKNYDLESLEGKKAIREALTTVNDSMSSPLPVLYQSGYLTIKGYDRTTRFYTLGFPNKEVENGFINFLVPYFTPIPDGEEAEYLSEFITDVNGGKPDRFLRRMQALFAGQDYRIAGDMEIYFQNVFYVLFRLLGFYVTVERATSHGRMDVTIETPGYVYVIELKLDGTAEDALRQIKEKGYARQFRMDKRKVYLIGVNFSSETRGIEKWVIE